MNMDESAEGNQSDERMIGEEIDRLRNRGLEEGHLLLNYASIEDEHENRRLRRRRGVGGLVLVLDGCVLREELGRKVVVRDGGVSRWKMVALKAERADPDLGDEIDDGERVENGAAGAAAERAVRDDGDVGEGLDRSVDRRHRDDAARRLLLRAGQHVPRHSDAVLRL